MDWPFNKPPTIKFVMPWKQVEIQQMIEASNQKHRREWQRMYPEMDYDKVKDYVDGKAR